jgi:hypothetical protein
MGRLLVRLDHSRLAVIFALLLVARRIMDLPSSAFCRVSQEKETGGNGDTSACRHCEWVAVCVLRNLRDVGPDVWASVDAPMMDLARVG